MTKYLTMIITVGLLLIGGTGCTTTGGNAGEGVSAPRHDAAGVTERIAYNGTIAYVIARKHIPWEKREAARRALLGFDAIVRAHLGTDDADAAVTLDLLDLILDHAGTDPEVRMYVKLLTKSILDQLGAHGVDFAVLDNAEAWDVVISIHKGIYEALRLAGIDPTQEVPKDG